MSDTAAQRQVVMVTAGADGIGRVIAEAFMTAGYAVHVCDIDTRRLEDFLAANPNASGNVADVADDKAVAATLAELESRHGRLDVLVNNAGIAGPTAAVEDIDVSDWDRTLAVDLTGPFLCARHAVPLLKVRGGSMINIASNAGLFGFPFRLPYAACKWAMIGMTKTLAMELGPAGIRVNALCPGSVSGDRIEGVIERDARQQGVSADEVRGLYQRQSSLRCFVGPEDVAAMALFLASDAGRRISGQAIGIDGHTEFLSHALD